MPNAPMSVASQLGLTMRFEVEVAGVDLGGWSSCDGLKVNFGLKEIKSGGDNECSHWTPERISYEKVVLKRAMTSGDSAKVMGWLRKMVDKGSGDTATITLKDAKNGEVAKWDLRNVLPFAWAGPTLAADSKNVAVETLTLVHEGFL
jgi:phage tail-like protein